MANNTDPDPDQLASLNLHCFQKQDISGFSRIRIKILETKSIYLQTVGEELIIQVLKRLTNF